MTKKHLPHLTYNWISAFGAVAAVITLLTILFLLVLNMVYGAITPYLGVLLYMLLPFILVAALLLIPFGMYVKRRALMRAGELTPRKWPSIDLNNHQQRNATMIFVFGTVLLLMISSVGVYKAYQFTDSVQFCGLVCHRVMAPEYTTYQNSPHAHVKCVDCHIGPGAGWYAKSKLSGMYQVYATIFNKYPRPLPTPIEDLRPVQQECYQCHWPSQFYGAKQRVFIHYMYDKGNTYWPVNLLIETGGGYPGAAQTSGIHWHMNISQKVEYISRDSVKQDIPWIRTTNRATGKVNIYEDSVKPLTKKEVESAEIRTMDCIDCHNRPSHNFRSPDHEVDLAIFQGKIPADLPDIKKACVTAMAKEYATDREAMEGISKSITEFYKNGYPDVYSKHPDAVEKAVAATQTAFSENIFPHMKARWSEYPNNIGHFIYKGCMRCHDGNHKDASGNLVVHDCNTCHIILSQGGGENGGLLDLKKGLDFRHPADIGDAWKETLCSDCHSGVQP